MKTHFLLVAATACLALQANAQETLTLQKDNIDKILAAMTVEEKCHFVVGNGQKDALTGDELVIIGNCRSMIPGCAGTTYPIPRLGIPAVVYADGPAGVRIDRTRKGDDRTYDCTAFPVAASIASTWDPQVVRKVGEAFGEEIRERGVDVILGPALNINRNPLCGRNFEYFSEDPAISGYMAAAMVEGIQSKGVGACIKHFAANNEEINRLACDSRMSTRALREIYLKGFEIAVRESAPWTLMTSYNYLNGVYTSESAELLEGILRGDWGFEGMVMTDWGGGQHPVDQIAAGNDNIQSGSGKAFKAIYAAAQSGELPMEALDACVRRILELIVKCPRFEGYKFSDQLDFQAHEAVSREAAADGMVLLRNEDEALPLAAGSRVAMFGPASYNIIGKGLGSGNVNGKPVVGLLEALRDAGIRPDEALDKTYLDYLLKESQRVAAINAGRKWYTWPELEHEMPLMALQDAATKAAATSDIAIYTISRICGEGTDRHIDADFNLTEREKQSLATVARAFHKVGKKMVVLLNVGSTVETASWKEWADAILVTWYPGQMAGSAIADVLTGAVNPSGCLPATFPLAYADIPAQNFPALNLLTGKNDSFYHYGPTLSTEFKNIDYIDYTEDIFVGYRYFSTFGVPVSYPFGWGLSYTTFATPKASASLDGGSVKVSVIVKNTGHVEGRHVVQVYSTLPAGSAPQVKAGKGLDDKFTPVGDCGKASGPADFAESAPARELKAFCKTPSIMPKKACKVELSFPLGELSYFDEQRSAWVVPAGVHTIAVCADADTPLLEMQIKVKKEIVTEVSRSLEPKNKIYSAR